jgi:endonuclease G
MKKALGISLALVLIGAMLYIYIACSSTNGVARNAVKDSRSLADSNLQVIHHKYYTLAYSEKHEQAVWVKYTLVKEHVGGEEPRANQFYVDPLVSTQSANDGDYYKSGYDRGHIAPAADMSWSADAIRESFYYSNMSPQVPSFNRGIWKKLEEMVRRWAVQYDSVRVIAGPVFVDNRGRIGPNGVTVPGYYYKAVLVFANSAYEGIAFIMPNRKVTEPLQNFIVTIDSAEVATHLDLYSELPDSIEELVESKVNSTLWGFTPNKP